MMSEIQLSVPSSTYPTSACSTSSISRIGEANCSSMVPNDTPAARAFVAVLLVSGLALAVETSPLLAALFLGVIQANVTRDRERFVDALFSDFWPAILVVFFPIMVNVLGSVRAVDPAMINLARTFNATRWQIFWKIEFPASMPALFSGLRIGSTLAVIGVTVGELVGGINRGIGFLLLSGETMGAPLVFLAIIMLTLIGIVAYGAVILIERHVLHYLPRRDFGGVNGQGGK